VARPNDSSGIRGATKTEDDPLYPGEAAVECEQQQGQARCGYRWEVEAQGPPFERDRANQRAHTQDEEDHDEVGPDDVADGKSRAPLPHGVDADSELRQTRAECDHGEADHDGSHAEVRRERGPAANEQFRPNEEPRKPSHEEQCTRHGEMLRAVVCDGRRVRRPRMAARARDRRPVQGTAGGRDVTRAGRRVASEMRFTE
jgi:hypothetical protein